LIPLELYVFNGRWPQTTTNETYQLFQMVKLNYLSKIGLNNSFDHDKLEEKVKSMEERWLVYEQRLI
jgi:hypothetical protein